MNMHINWVSRVKSSVVLSFNDASSRERSNGRIVTNKPYLVVLTDDEHLDQISA